MRKLLFVTALILNGLVIFGNPRTLSADTVFDGACFVTEDMMGFYYLTDIEQGSQSTGSNVICASPNVCGYPRGMPSTCVLSVGTAP